MGKLVAAIVRPGSEARRRDEQAGLVQSHLSSRLRAGFELDEVLLEIAILGRVIVRIASAAPPEGRLDVDGLDRVLADLHAAGATITQAVAEYMREDERVEALRLERALRSEFVAVLAHDLHGPLAAARMAAAMGDDAEAAGPAGRTRHRDIVLRNLDRVDRMVTDLLDVDLHPEAELWSRA